MNAKSLRYAFLSLLTAVSPMTFSADGYEPPLNPYLADSPWPMSHRTPYAQGSSPYIGPTSTRDLRRADHKNVNFVNITLAMSPEYSDGSRVYWGSTSGEVYKVRANTAGLALIDKADKPSGGGLEAIFNGVSGAYTIVSHDNTFYTVDGQSIVAYVDGGTYNSDIELRNTYALSQDFLRGDDGADPIVGMTMLWNGHIAVATKLGTVAVVSSDFSSSWYLNLGDDAEEVTNSIAADENGGIYVVSSEQMHRVQWTGTGLSSNESDGAWSSDYENGDGSVFAGRLGTGSGSTPSLMGTDDGDRFVVITDGQELAHLVLFWRDEIPDDWVGLPGKDRRIAAEVPVTFGENDREVTVSEQSVLVRGYGAVVVSNDYRNYFLLPESTGTFAIDQATSTIAVYYSGMTLHQPYGVQKFEWNSQTRQLEIAWVNEETSCPNGIPTMSAQTQMFYCIGAKYGYWTLEGLDWNTGDNVFRKLLGRNNKYNSFYAGTQIGDDGAIVSGTTFGVMEIDPR